MTKDFDKDFKRDFISGIAVITLFLFAYIYVPLVGPFISIFTPLPILFYYEKLGRIPVILIFCIASMIATFFLKSFQTQTGMFFIIEFGVIGLTISEILRKNLSIEKTVLYSLFIILGVGITIAFLYCAINVIHPWTLVVQQINENVTSTINLYQGGGTPAEQTGVSEAYFANLTNFLIRTFPSLAIVGMIFIIWLNLMIAQRLYRIRKIQFPDFGDLSEWKAPDLFVWGVISGGLLLLPGVFILKSVGLNLLILSLSVFFFQGIAIVSYFFHRKNIPLILRGIGYGMIIIQHIFLVTVVGLGFFDVWADFRKLKKPKLS